ncbi:MAG TPA: CDC48 family AAA ATPase [Firmicutes bacterium]|nr:CDC48 family AAA ATPase [Bacillota bacterium]
MAGNKFEPLKLRVVEALLEDARKGIVRVSQARFDQLGLTLGEIVAVTGRRTTYARLVPALSNQCTENEIMLDGITRENAGTTLHAEVTLSPATYKDAGSIVLTPLDPGTTFDREEDVEFLKRYIVGLPVTVEDKVAISLFGAKEASLRVTGTAPSGPVMITARTLIRIQKPDVFESALPKVTYEDIGGLAQQVRLVREIIELPLKYPEVFVRLGIEPPKGILLYGPPGTGKTLIARAVAGESGIHFIHVNGPEVMHKFYGESEARLREVFDEARRKAPSILFLDELDALAPKRSEVIGDVEKRVVGQLLALMDGMVSRGQVIVIGATNMPSLLDPALRRPGRFDREIFIPVPDRAGRLEIFQIHTRGMALAADVDLNTLASMTHGYVGADIASLCREAGMLALRRISPKLASLRPEERNELIGDLRVTMRDFVEAARDIQPSATREFFTELPDVKWEDVGGLDHIKEMLTELISWPIKYPEQFMQFGITSVRGVLFTGPSGTGKTLLAKALARETGVNFISVLGPSLFSKWFGESERALRELFQRAKQASPCILCIDEIDALAGMRGGQGSVSERIVSQLLMELDGLEDLKDVIVVGTTNRQDLIDPAFLRPGRFDLIVEFPLPDAADRLEIFKVHLRGKPVDQDVNLDQLAQSTEGLTGADISGICRRAAFLALGRHLAGDVKRSRIASHEAPTHPVITMEHFQRALEEVRHRKPERST